jgi:hypothetical protein
MRRIREVVSAYTSKFISSACTVQCPLDLCSINLKFSTNHITIKLDTAVAPCYTALHNIQIPLFICDEFIVDEAQLHIMLED